MEYIISLLLFLLIAGGLYLTIGVKNIFDRYKLFFQKSYKSLYCDFLNIGMAHYLDLEIFEYLQPGRHRMPANNLLVV